MSRSDATFRRRVPIGDAGFTLIEILIAGTIAALLSAALAHVFSGVLQMSREVRSSQVGRRDARLAITLLRQDVGRAETIVTATDTLLMMRMENGDSVSYSWDGNPLSPLERQLNSDAKETVAGSIDSVSFGLQIILRPHTFEKLVPDTIETLIMKWEPGDWDDWCATTSCDPATAGHYRVDDEDWAGEELYPSQNFLTASRAEVRVSGHAGPGDMGEVDMLLEVYEASGGASQYPGTRISAGRINRTDLTALFAWNTANLTPDGSTPIVAGGHYWVVMRPDGSGWFSYAGCVEYDRIQDCDAGDWPTNNMVYRETGNYGATWGAGGYENELFYRLYGLQTVPRLGEVTEDLPDTLGVTYMLAITTNEESAQHAGYCALYNL